MNSWCVCTRGCLVPAALVSTLKREMKNLSVPNSFWEYLCYFLSFQEMQALISKDLTREKEKEN